MKDKEGQRFTNREDAKMKGMTEEDKDDIEKLMNTNYFKLVYIYLSLRIQQFLDRWRTGNAERRCEE